MLSTTNTLNDIKAELETYDFYGFSSTGLFDAALLYATGESKRMILVPVIGSTAYTNIQDKDKVSLNEIEEHVYFAEVNYAIYTFLEKIARSELYKKKSRRETIGMNGESRSNSGSLGSEMASDEFYRRGRTELQLAGYDISIKVTRRFSIFSDDNTYKNSGFYPSC